MTSPYNNISSSSSPASSYSVNFQINVEIGDLSKMSILKDKFKELIRNQNYISFSSIDVIRNPTVDFQINVEINHPSKVSILTDKFKELIRNQNYISFSSIDVIRNPSTPKREKSSSVPNANPNEQNKRQKEAPVRVPSQPWRWMIPSHSGHPEIITNPITAEHCAVLPVQREKRQRDESSSVPNANPNEQNKRQQEAPVRVPSQPWRWMIPAHSGHPEIITNPIPAEHCAIRPVQREKRQRDERSSVPNAEAELSQQVPAAGASDNNIKENDVTAPENNASSSI